MSEYLLAFSYPQITTPDIAEDLAAYVFPEVDGQSLKDGWQSLHGELRSKFTVLAERLEFIGRLDIVRKELCRLQSSRTEDILADGGLHARRVARFECRFLDEDFAGVNFDIESLQFYLLASCLDALAGQPEYVSPFEWLRSRADEQGTICASSLDELDAAYTAKHGLSRQFRSLFEESLTDGSLRKEWLDGYCVVAVDAPTNDQPAKLNRESLQAWQTKKDDEKIKAIAVALYEMRSRFTHASGREFRRDMPIKCLLCRRQKHLIRVGERSLYEIMLRTVQAAAKRVWDSAEGPHGN